MSVNSSQLGNFADFPDPITGLSGPQFDPATHLLEFFDEQGNPQGNFTAGYVRAATGITMITWFLAMVIRAIGG